MVNASVALAADRDNNLPAPRMERISDPDFNRRTPGIMTLVRAAPEETHVALGLGLAACQKGLSVGFTTAAALVDELMEARDERRLMRVGEDPAPSAYLTCEVPGA